jgi:hypothetical protein
MKMVAVTTLRDPAGAEVAKELLAERGISAEIRRLGYNPYFGAPTAEEFEVRVPEDAVADAHAVIAGMAEELERAALSEAGVSLDDEDGGGYDRDTLPPPELRRRNVAWAIALGLVGPLPGCGVLYARAFALGWSMAGASLVLFIAGVAAGNAEWLAIVGALKAADVVIAPFAAARFNRKLEESHAAYA